MMFRLYFHQRDNANFIPTISEKYSVIVFFPTTLLLVTEDDYGSVQSTLVNTAKTKDGGCWLNIVKVTSSYCTLLVSIDFFNTLTNILKQNQESTALLAAL